MKEYAIWYVNPNIKGDELKVLTDFRNKRVVVKARNKKEAEHKACKRLVTTGLFYQVELLTGV